MAIPRNFDEYREIYLESVKEPGAFWSAYAEENFQWIRKWDRVLDYDLNEPRIEWFKNARLNITENCIDRHLKDRKDQTAIVWEPNNPNDQAIHISYTQLHNEVCRTANMLKSLGVVKGDRVCLYLPMVPELAFSVLACARIGAIHSVVFAGFSSGSLADRINDANCKLLITADGAKRGAKITPLKEISDEALAHCPGVEKLVVLKHAANDINIKEGRDLDWEELISEQSAECPAEPMDAEDPLFILYTSGSTGKPKGMVHTCAGYMVYTHYTFKNVFQYQPGDIYWCTADIGWITGHSYILYGPLAAGATTIMFEGVPSYPDMGRFWQIVEKHKVNIFYTAPTAIRALAACETSFVKRSDLSSLKVLGTVGEPINEEAWNWYNREVGGNRCPIVDTWWQTETGGIMISSISGITPSIATFATTPLPGIQPCLMDPGGNEIREIEAEGSLCIKFPWPGMARTIYGDHERFKNTYYSTFPGHYFSGDGAKRDAQGNYRITGRMDDVLIVSGHNLGTAEIEDALNQHEMVAESAVVGFDHPIKGHAVYAFVSCSEEAAEPDRLRAELLKLVSDIIGPVAKPDKIQLVDGLPKTRSGKIMRRILRKIANGEVGNYGDISTLLNPEVVSSIAANAI